MIELRRRFRFAPEPDERLVRIGMVGKHALERDDAAGMPLTRAIDHAHAAPPDLFEDLVTAQAPLFVGHVRFRKDILEDLSRGFAFRSQSLTEEAIRAKALLNPCAHATRFTFASALQRAHIRV